MEMGVGMDCEGSGIGYSDLGGRVEFCKKVLENGVIPSGYRGDEGRRRGVCFDLV